MRDLHARDADGRAGLPRRRRRPGRGRRSARRSPATSAAAPATPRSSRRSRPPRAPGPEDRREPGIRSHRGADQRPPAASGRRGPDARLARAGPSPGAPSAAELSAALSPRQLADRLRDPGLARSCCSSAVPGEAGRAADADAGRTARHQPARPGRGLRDPGATAPSGRSPAATDLMVALTGELGEPPERILDLWRLDELRGIALDGDAIILGALTTYTEIRRSAVCREHLPVLVEAAATIGAAQIQNRGDDRRQRRQRLAGRRHAAGPARRRRHLRASVRAAWRADRPRRARSGRPTGGPRSPPTSSCSASGSRSSPVARLRFRKVGTRRAQSISKVVLALGWRDSGGPLGRAWTRRPPRARVGGADPDPGDRHRGASSRAGRRPRRPPIVPPRRWPRELASDRRRPLDRGLPAAGRRPRPPSAHPRGRRLVMTDGPAVAVDRRPRRRSRRARSPPRSRRCSRARAASSAGWRWPGRSARPRRCSRAPARSPTRCRSTSSSS